MGNLVNLDRVVIDDNQIVVNGASTSFVNVGFMPEQCIKSLAERRKKILKLAKSKGIKVSFKSKTKQAIEENQDSYKDSYESYKAHFHLLKCLWETKVKKGIPVGSSTDQEINVMSRLSNKIESMWRRSTDLDVINDVAIRIRRLEELINSNDEVEKITL